MKKLTIDPRFWLTAAFCAALLAAPPLAVQARDRQLDPPRGIGHNDR